MKKPPKKQLQIIAPNDYPQALSKPNVARASKTLRSPQTAEKAQAAMEAQVPAMRAAILEYVEELEKAQGDMALIFEKAHEIRGFAETAGLAITGSGQTMTLHQ